jgi:hypothetical protein
MKRCTSLYALTATLLFATPALAQEARPLGYFTQPTAPPRFDDLPPGALADVPAPDKPLEKNRSGFTIALDIAANSPRTSPNSAGPGFGFDLRVGQRVDLGRLFLVPELEFGVFDFPHGELGFRYGGGLRLGLDLGRLEPSAYVLGGGFGAGAAGGGGLRTGLSLDYRALKVLAPGVHLDANYAGWPASMDGSWLGSTHGGSTFFVSAGAHLGFVL